MKYGMEDALVKKLDASNNIKDILVQIGKKEGVQPGNNPYLNKFLETHYRPSVSYMNPNFDLNIEPRYHFKPPIRKAPFSSTGEPWPMPKYYKTVNDILLKLDTSSFEITLLNENSCDILVNAIKRYDNIIKNLTIEEHYEFVYNYDENLFNFHQSEIEDKYRNTQPMKNLEIEVISDECGYPDVDMDESYTLNLHPSSSVLVAKQVWGALRGIETFSQLLFRRRNTDQIYARDTEIDDEPRFPHRGILLDTSRHFMHLYTIFNVLDGMSYNKMNVLHWHIIDDNSFPYQSLVFPKLSEKGAFHPTLVYTQKNIKDIVDYARMRGIRVVPEFDSPGHSFSWLGYPDIKSTCYVNDQPIQGPMGPINPAQDETYNFMSKLFAEIYQVFPDNYVHLGGDELHTTCWATNPQITEYLEKHGNIPASEAITNAGNYVNRAIGYYFKRLIETLKSTAVTQDKKKSFIMWEDVLKNTQEVPKDSILQVWLGRPQNVRALNSQGYRALFSSCWYLDSYKRQPMWVDYYNCEPSPYATESEEKNKLLGGEACLWAEFITTDTLMTFMWPRASAPAERLWSPKSTTNLGSAMRRIQEQRCRMIYRGLPTGHISGPDYCLRPRDGPLGVRDDHLTPSRTSDTSYSVRDKEKNGEHISVIFLSHYQNYLPLVNVVLSLTGVYLIVIASKCWRRKARENKGFPKSI
ncbi:hypothetical protein ACF0H5_005636 [Mactra antiquata]